MLLTGFGMMVQMAASNTILQTIVEEDKRGRVMSFYSMAFLGMTPFGSLFAGVLAATDRRYRDGDASAASHVWLAAALFAIRLPRLRGAGPADLRPDGDSAGGRRPALQAQTQLTVPPEH